MSEIESPAKADATDTPAQAEQEPTQPTVEKDPNWLPARLERERRSMLKQLGAENVDDVKAALDDLKKRRDAEKSEQDRLRAQVAELETKAKRVADLESVVALRANSELATLTEAQREAVLGVAGDDPTAQLRALEKLRPTWTVADAKPLTKAAPANTAPAAKSPAPTASADENVLLTFERLSKTDPQMASAYRLANLPRYLEALKTRA